MMHKTHAELLTILKDSTTDLSTADIFKIACDNPETQIPDPEHLSKLMYSARTRGYVTTSIAGKGKSHKITQQGLNALDEYNGITTKKEVKDMTTDTLLDAPVQSWESVIQPEQLQHQPALTERFYLDQNNEFESAMMLIALALRDIRSQPEPRKIERKSEKISTLHRLGALMSDDIKLIFDEIIADLDAG